MRTTITKIIVCDDHPVFRQGLVQVIENQDALILVGECSEGKTALKRIRELKPDVAILDISMPEMDGIEVTRLLKIENIPTKIIILTMYKEKVYFDRAMDAGAMGYLLKENAESGSSQMLSETLSDSTIVFVYPIDRSTDVNYWLNGWNKAPVQFGWVNNHGSLIRKKLSVIPEIFTIKYKQIQLLSLLKCVMTSLRDC